LLPNKIINTLSFSEIVPIKRISILLFSTSIERLAFQSDFCLFKGLSNGVGSMGLPPPPPTFQFGLYFCNFILNDYLLMLMVLSIERSQATAKESSRWWQNAITRKKKVNCCFVNVRSL